MAKDKVRDAEYSEQESKPPEWLVMVYLAGDNNLSANCIDILQELEAAAPPKDVRVLACFDANTPRPRGARYFEINFRRVNHPNTHFNWALHDDLVPFKQLPGHPVEAPDFCCDYDDDEPGHPPPTTEPTAVEGLSRFIRFSLRRHGDAKRRMLILFGHGSAVAGNTFLADNTPPSFLRLKELKEVLARHFEARSQPLSQADKDENDDVPDEELSEEEKEEKRRRKPLDILACDNCMMNGIESAFELRRRVKYIIGSQGLVLALGWPFRKVIEEIVRNKTKPSEYVAERILRRCARNLLDFALMDRSSEQSLCDITTLRKSKNLVTAVRNLSRAMQDGLALDDCGNVKYPAIRDAIRLARLEAQSYWSETFVDLYDFCLLLVQRCNDIKTLQFNLSPERRAPHMARGSRRDEGSADRVIGVQIMQTFRKIADACNEVLKALKTGSKFVLLSYYVGPDLQYSNGVSIYFPWTLPEDPIIFDPESGSGGGGGYFVSWSGLDRIKRLAAARIRREAEAKQLDSLEQLLDIEKQPTDYKLVTAFDEYKTYEFAKRTGGNWTAFLKAFFKATLRNVRRFEIEYRAPSDKKAEQLFLEDFDLREQPFFESSPINLQKSSSDVDSEYDCACPTIKNYPRRFYLSPADCRRRCHVPEQDDDCRPVPPTDETCPPLSKQDKKLCASYLGWNVRGVVAEVIDLHDNPRRDSSGKDEGARERRTKKPKKA